MKVEIEIVPGNLLTVKGNAPFNPSKLSCPVCGEKMRLKEMHPDGREYDFRFECFRCEAELWVETRQYP